jgi:hypothetical protein
MHQQSLRIDARGRGGGGEFRGGGFEKLLNGNGHAEMMGWVAQNSPKETLINAMVIILAAETQRTQSFFSINPLGVLCALCVSAADNQ